jgi:hypothetical protein
MLCNPGRYRVSHHIKQPTVAAILNAVNLAREKGLPLNYMVTLNFSKTNCPEEAVSEIFALLRDNHCTPYLRRPQKRRGLDGVQHTYVWTLENHNGVHGHWLVHLPEGRDGLFMEKLPLWLEKVTGGVICPSAIDIRPAHNAVGAAKYMLKGINPIWASTYGIEASEQGRIVGKRGGTSRNVCKTERLRCVERGEVQPLRRTFRKPSRILELAGHRA